MTQSLDGLALRHWNRHDVLMTTDTTNRIRPIDGHGLVGLAMAVAWLQTTWERCYVQARYVPPGEYAARGPANAAREVAS